MAKMSKKKFEELGEKLSPEKKTVWDSASDGERKEIFALCDRYMDFLDNAKTERLAVNRVREMAEAKGFKDIEAKGGGKKFYAVFQNKVIALAVLGKKKPSQGLRILGAHSDAPRLDLKGKPVYENTELAFLKTHYYGGIKKYQWLSRPLAIHGVICLKNGKTVSLCLGEDDKDPVFTVLDLLPHLSRKVQGEKKLNEAIEGERMNLVIGGLPIDAEEGKDKVKLGVLKLLNDSYGIVEEDFISAELEIVPAGKARDVGLDRALIGAYAQDDRSSSFASVNAILEVEKPDVTSLALLFDKEEIGSDGSTGAQSRFLELLIAKLMEKAGEEASFLKVAQAMANSQALSADVTGAFDPDYPEVHEKTNAAYMGYGVCLHKYTGHGGKYGASDANAEYMAWVRNVWDEAGVTWQAAAMGKIDEGGGGTIAKFLAKTGMEVVDVGPPLLSMHSPFEICHKADIYSACQAFKVFLEAPAR